MSRIMIIAGTDTDVGKTVVTAACASALLSTGRHVRVIKPCQTGLQPGEPGDVHQVADLAGLTPGQIAEFVRLPEALAPTTAARRAGMSVPTVAELAGRIITCAEAGETVTLVEGAGGVLVGLDNAGATLLDLADVLRAAGQPATFVVAARSGLGTLNHTALTCNAIRDRGHHVAGVIIGAWPAQPDLAEECNLAEIDAAAGAPLLAAIPAGIGSNPAALREAAQHIDIERLLQEK